MGWRVAHAGEEERSEELGLGRLWAVERKRGREGLRGRREGMLGWAACFYSFPFSSSFLYSLIQTTPIEFNLQFEFKPINSAQIKQCCGMNAQTL
jgi:hypothetical protein